MIEWTNNKNNSGGKISKTKGLRLRRSSSVGCDSGDSFKDCWGACLGLGLWIVPYLSRELGGRRSCTTKRFQISNNVVSPLNTTWPMDHPSRNTWVGPGLLSVLWDPIQKCKKLQTMFLQTLWHSSYSPHSVHCTSAHAYMLTLVSPNISWTRLPCSDENHQPQIIKYFAYFACACVTIYIIFTRSLGPVRPQH